MARITVEDCTEVVQNRFELVALAAKRGKNIASGAAIFVSRDNDKNAVIALREIAAKRVDTQNLRNILVQGFRKNAKYILDEDQESDIQEISEEQLQDSLGNEITQEIKSLTTIEKDDDLLFSEDELDIED